MRAAGNPENQTRIPAGSRGYPSGRVSPAGPCTPRRNHVDIGDSVSGHAQARVYRRVLGGRSAGNRARLGQRVQQPKRRAEGHEPGRPRRSAIPGRVPAERHRLSEWQDHRVRGHARWRPGQPAQWRCAGAERHDDHRRHRSEEAEGDLPYSRPRRGRSGTDGAHVPRLRAARRGARPRLPDAQHPGQCRPAIGLRDLGRDRCQEAIARGILAGRSQHAQAVVGVQERSRLHAGQSGRAGAQSVAPGPVDGHL